MACDVSGRRREMCNMCFVSYWFGRKGQFKETCGEIDDYSHLSFTTDDS